MQMVTITGKPGSKLLGGRACVFAALLLVCLVFVITGCTKQEVVRCTSPEDNPQHHYLRGMEALERVQDAFFRGKFDVSSDLQTAGEKFERALYCDSGFFPASGGLAIVSAYKVRQQKDQGYASVDRQRAIDYVQKGGKDTKTDEDKFDHYLSVIRVDAVMHGKDWVGKVEDAYKRAKDLKADERKLSYYQGAEALDYYMGLAYWEAREFQKSRDRFSDVLNSRREGKWHEKADKAWKRVDKIVRALAGITVGDVGKAIAVKDSISRGDLTALLIDELKIDKLFAGRIPVQSQLDKMKPEFSPADISGHHFKEEIETVMKWKIRGLEPKYEDAAKAYLFKPGDAVTRGEMAMILEDVLIKLTGDEKLATAFFGQERSPFPDVRPTSAFYNSVMNMTTRNIMEGELSGEFRISAPVDGAEALLAIRVLKQKMNIY